MFAMFVVAALVWPHGVWVEHQGLSSIALATPQVAQRNALELPTGVNMQVLRSDAVAPFDNVEASRPLIVFVHGSLHGAWCWGQRWMPELARRGYSSVALNLRGTSGCPVPEGYNGGRKVIKLSDHVADLEGALELLIAEAGDRGVVLVGHSFGGFKLMKLMEQPGVARHFSEGLRGLALLCSVPPEGNTGLAWRLLFAKPILAWKVTWGLAAKAVLRDDDLCREVFLDKATPRAEVARMRSLLNMDAEYGLDLREVNDNLPANVADASRTGVAAWVGGKTGLPERCILVLGSGEDAIVDAEGIEETAQFCNVSATIIHGGAHDIMLDGQHWREGFDALGQWLVGLPGAAP